MSERLGISTAKGFLDNIVTEEDIQKTWTQICNGVFAFGTDGVFCEFEVGKTYLVTLKTNDEDVAFVLSVCRETATAISSHSSFGSGCTVSLKYVYDSEGEVGQKHLLYVMCPDRKGEMERMTLAYAELL